MLSLAIAFLAGAATIAAPCTLPVLPILLGASLGRVGSIRPVFIAAGFVISFSFVALALSAITAAFDFDPGHLREAAAIALVVFGLLMIWPQPFAWLTQSLRLAIPTRQTALLPSVDRTGNIGGFLVGTALGMVWTPCAGPTLATILTLIATSQDIASARLQLVAYAVGAAIPMLAIAYGGQAITSRTRRFARYAPRLQQAFGFVVIAFGVVTYLQYDAVIVAWLTQLYPTRFDTL
jgi:cytochrome c biogenesis protein CcdA